MIIHKQKPFKGAAFQTTLENAFNIQLAPVATCLNRLWEIGLGFDIWFEVVSKSGFILSDLEAAGELGLALDYAGQGGAYVAIAVLSNAMPSALVLGRPKPKRLGEYDLILVDADYLEFIEFSSIQELLSAIVVYGYAVQYDPETRRPKLYSRDQLAHVFLDDNQPRAAL